MNTIYSQILTDQKEERLLFQANGWVQRIPEKFIDKDSSLIQIITGVRRSGKSTLAHKALQGTNYAYINFDDERLSKLSAANLNDLLEAVYRVYENVEYLFLDEIQNVDGWHLFVNRLHRNGLKVIITGSNSKLLSSELASHLTGRYSIIELFPFSFVEYLKFKGIESVPLTTKTRGELMGCYDEYLTNGGFPEVAKGTDAKQYALNLFNAIVSRDILFRFNIKHKQTFKDIAMFLANNFSREISYNRLKMLFELGSEHTAKNYVAFLEEAYLIMTIPKFSYKKAESIKYRKSYLIDTSIALALCDNFTQNIGFIYENIVFLELMRRKTVENFELFYYKKNVEVDFVIYKNRTVETLIQVCYNMENDKTFKREVRSLIQASTELNVKNLIIISSTDNREIEIDGKVIKVVPIYEWLLGN